MKKELNLEFYKLTNKQKKAISKKAANIKINDYFFDISEQEFDTIDIHRDDDEYIDECARTCIARLMEICEKHEVSINNIEDLNIFVVQSSDIEKGRYYLCHAYQILGIDNINLFVFRDDPKGYYEYKLSTDLHRNKKIYLAYKDSYINSFANMVLLDKDVNVSSYDQETLTEMITERIKFIWSTMNILSYYTTPGTVDLIIPKNVYKYLDEFAIIIISLINENFGIILHCINKHGLEKIAKLTI